MRQKNNFIILVFPLIAFILLGLIVFIERTGVIYGRQNNTLSILGPQNTPKPSNYQESTPECLLLYSSSEENWENYYQSVRDTINSMRVRCDDFDISSQDGFNSTVNYDLNKYKTVVVTNRNFFIEEQFSSLIQWVESGGRILITRTPKLTPTFMLFSNKLGIQSQADQEMIVKGVNFATDLMPGSKNFHLSSEDAFSHYSLPVVLEKEAVIHLTSSDSYSLPLLWEYSLGQGRIVFINSSALYTKLSRGIVGAAYSLLQDFFVYPVINSSMIFIDDFPAPLSEGKDPEFKKEYNMDNRDFFVNVWWPETYALAKDYSLKYTGVLVETYNFNTSPPFEQYASLDDFRSMGGYLLKNGGQLGLHGYNHIPLCLEKDGANQIYNYPSWSSVEAMQGAMQELDNFARYLYPGRNFTLYVPASNVLCPDMRKLLPKTLPDIKIISSEYNISTNEMLYSQEFEEAKDGIIELPRITAGYSLGEYAQWSIINELSLHYVYSHFIHPDDVLDDIRSSSKSWRQLKNDFEEHLQWLTKAAPGIRHMTADDGAAAVQRFTRLKVNTISEPGSCKISLGNFYDEAWLMLRTSKKPTAIQGGTFTPVTSNLYLIHALEPEIKINY